MSKNEIPSFISLPTLGGRVSFGFFGRAGGVSKGFYEGLNCGKGSDDDRAAVDENRARVARALGLTPDRLLNLYQTHSANVHEAAQPWTATDLPRADAVVTTERRLGLAILTADCAPVLFADDKAGVVGAAHAGWKGAFGGVLENTLAAMEARGGVRSRMRAVIGPTISQTKYEVGPEFRAQFVAADPANERFFIPSKKSDHHHFNLPAYCGARLVAAGLRHIVNVAECTYAGENRYFSYRRATHRGEQGYGRNISVIVLEA